MTTPRAWRTDAAIVAGLFVMFIGLGGHIVRQIMAYPLPGGWDGTAHYAVTELYVRNHFPLPHGWMPEYFGGMAFPDYYPPLLYWLAGGLSFATGTVTAINLVFLGSTLAIIALTYDVARRLAGSRVTAALAAMLAIQLLVDGGEQANFGIALRATFSVGLASHVLGYALLLATIRMALASTRRRRIIGTSVFLALTILSNLHITLDAVALFGFVVVFQLCWAPARERFDVVIIGLVALGLSALFWLPLLADRGALPTYAMPPRFPGAIVLVPMAVIAAGAGWWATLTRNAWAAAMSLVILLAAALCIFDLTQVFPNAPLQPWRLAAAGLFLTPIVLAVISSALLERGVAGKIALAVITVAYSLTFHRATVYEYALTTGRARTYDRVFASMRGHTSGRVLVEAGGDGADAYALQVLMPLHGHASATGVFREASIGSLFAMPLQTRFSESERVFGIDTKVDMNVFFGVTSPTELGGVLRAFDVTHVVAHSQRIKELLATFPGVHALGSGDWVAYELPWTSELVSSPRFEPVVVAAPFTVKKRTGSTDFIRLSEELMARGVVDYATALQHKCALTDRTELARFRVVLILERCGSVEGATAELRTFVASGGTIIANARAVAELPADLVSAMHLVEHDDDPRAFYDGLIAALRQWVPARPAHAPIRAVVDREQVRIDVPAGEVTPVIVRNTFHPSWRASSGELYMSTFAQQLVWTEGPVVLSYTWSLGRKLGLVLSFLTLIGMLAVWRRARRQGSR